MGIFPRKRERSSTEQNTTEQNTTERPAEAASGGEDSGTWIYDWIYDVDGEHASER